MEYCSQHAQLKVTLPDENEKWLALRDFTRKLCVPYVIYSDFESLQSKQKPHNKVSITHKTRKHVASGFTYKKKLECSRMNVTSFLLMLDYAPRCTVLNTVKMRKRLQRV